MVGRGGEALGMRKQRCRAWLRLLEGDLGGAAGEVGRELGGAGTMFGESFLEEEAG